MAQQGGWSFDATLYLWATDTTTTLDTRFGEVESELSFSDALEQLDFAFMGAFEARNGPWSMVADYFYFRLSQTNSIDLPNLDKVRSETELSAFSGYGFYRVASGPNFYVDLGAGFRVYSIEQELSLSGPGRSAKAQASDTWTDPLIAARLRYDFNDRWFGTIGGDFGGFGGSDDQTWSVLATVGYEINDRWTIRGGWRALEIQQELDDDMNFTNNLSGPILGVTYRF
jgi:hypothetical protein